MEFPVLKMGSRGQEVRRWQKFLSRNQGIKLDPASMALDGVYGPGTTQGTRTYQINKGLVSSGIVDSTTYVQAVEDGFDPIIDV
ncbi:peptidoglycan-binding protein [Oculatella sp. FACHB-28]|uniref:peptidoglycan-binding domain-containing protein n=1 Tax=Oculatella sp. FACHB-28 TaxID=2692845 RepID=UPI0016851DEA|nr:peptidoglycan-binding domain-containing protein [Oculatella sp. FACHB-28]MBD2056973.1 peptidoglycan-binding protein [Oculatella sp. FACHB-28]